MPLANRPWLYTHLEILQCEIQTLNAKIQSETGLILECTIKQPIIADSPTVPNTKFMLELTEFEKLN